MSAGWRGRGARAAGVLRPAGGARPRQPGLRARAVGTTSAAQTATLTNTGAVPLAINVIVVDGSFAQTNNCPATLAPGGACAIAVTFTPAVAGDRQGVLSVFDDAAGSPQTVALTGTGVAPASPPPAPATYTVAAAANGERHDQPRRATTSYAGGARRHLHRDPRRRADLRRLDARRPVRRLRQPAGLHRQRQPHPRGPLRRPPDLLATSARSAPRTSRRSPSSPRSASSTRPGVNGSGQFQPDADVKRAEVAAFVARVFGWQRRVPRQHLPRQVRPAGARTASTTSSGTTSPR